MTRSRLRAIGVRLSEVTEYGAVAQRSVWPHARELDHLAPLLGFCRDELTKFGGRHRHRRITEIGKPRLDLGISEGSINLFVEFLDNLNRRVPRRAYPLPGRGLIAGHEIAYCRDIRQRVLTLGSSHCQGSQLARPDVPDR